MSARVVRATVRYAEIATDMTEVTLGFGVFEPRPNGPSRAGAAADGRVLDLAAAAAAGLLPDPGLWRDGTLTAFLAAGRPTWSATVARVQELVADPAGLPAGALLDAADVTPRLPFAVADYVDFYSSLHHAENVGRIFRPGDDPLLPNWRHLPVGYHGRSGTVVVSGTPIPRPVGQRGLDPAGRADCGPSTRLDLEAEIGWVVGVPSKLGNPLRTNDFREHVFGAVVLNDWSARDLQSWEYRPLGPFLGKSFATSISPWVVPLDLLEPSRVPPPAQEPPPPDYLRVDEPWGLDLQLDLVVNDTLVSRPPFASMYWTPPQQLAHLTSNGASVRTGDLFASGTVSGPARNQVGSLLELSWGGAEPFALADGSTRTYLLDGDVVTVRARAGELNLGGVTGRISPAR